MEPIKFKEMNITFAKDQPEYMPLPAYRDSKGEVISLWSLSIIERIKILLTGRMWLSVLTYNKPLQPILPLVDNPFEKSAESNGGEKER